jgi:hypothetical protein
VERRLWVFSLVAELVCEGGDKKHEVDAQTEELLWRTFPPSGLFSVLDSGFSLICMDWNIISDER